MGLSIWHLLLVLVILLMVFGPSRLGDLGTSLGQAIRGFKKGLNEDPEIDVTATAKRETLREGEPGPTTSSTSTKQNQNNKS